MSYAVFVWSALAIFLAGLIWDWISPALRIRALRSRYRKQQLIDREQP